MVPFGACRAAARPLSTITGAANVGVCPGPTPHWLFSNTFQFIKGMIGGLKANKPYAFVRAWHDEHGPLVKMDSMGFRNAVFVADPDVIKLIMQNDPANFTKGSTYDSIKRGWLDDTLVVSEGEEWRQKRAVYVRAFRLGAVRSYVPIFSEIAEDTSAEWLAQHEKGEVVDAVRSFESVAFEAIGRAGFGLEGMGKEDNTYAMAFTGYLTALNNEMMGLGQLLPGSLAQAITRWRGGRDLDLMVAESRRIVADAYAATSQRDQTRRNLVELMRDAMVEEGIELAPEQLAREANLFLFAGHDTTSATLAWVCYLLARSPEAQQRVHEELVVVAESELEGKLSDPRSFPFLNAVIKETLRLYSPAPLVVRQSKLEEEFNGIKFPAGTNFCPSLWSMHRDPKVFDEPDAFKPHRWTDSEPEEVKHMERYWLPFNTGARNCLGQMFSQMEMRTVLATLLRRFSLESASEAQVLQRMLLLPSNIKLRAIPR